MSFKVKIWEISFCFGLLFLSSPVQASEEVFWGGVLGGSLGGLVGNQFGHGSARSLNTGAGVVAGAIVGTQLGASMRRANSVSSGRAYLPAEPLYYAYPPPPYHPNYVAPPDSDIRVIYVERPVYVTGGYVGVP